MFILIYEEGIFVKTNEEYLKSLDDVDMYDNTYNNSEPILVMYCKEFDTRNLHDDTEMLLENINNKIFQYILNNKSSFEIIDYNLEHLIENHDELNEFILYLYSLNKAKFRYELDCYFDRYDYGYINKHMSKEKLYKYFKSFMCPDIDESELENIININYYYHGDDEIAYVCEYKAIEKESNGYKIIKYYPNINLSNDDETYMFLNDCDIIIFDVDDSFEIYNRILHFNNDWNNISEINNNIFMICKLNSCFTIIMTDNPIYDILLYYSPKLKNIEFIDYNLTSIVLHTYEYINDIDEYKIDNYWFKTLYNYDKNKFMKKLRKLYDEFDMENYYENVDDEYADNEYNSNKMFYKGSTSERIMNIINKQLND